MIVMGCHPRGDGKEGVSAGGLRRKRKAQDEPLEEATPAKS